MVKKTKTDVEKLVIQEIFIIFNEILTLTQKTMRKNLFHLIVGLFLLATTSCTDESIVNEQERLKVTGGVASESRTTFVLEDEKTLTHWETNDAIGLFTDQQSNVSYKATSGGSNTTDFVASGSESIESKEGDKVTAYYPFSKKVEGDEIPLPNTVGGYSNRPAPTFLVGEGTITNNNLNLNFKHLFAYLKITVSSKMYRSKYDPSYMELNGGGLRIDSSTPIAIMQGTYNLKTKAITHKDNTNTYIWYFFNGLNWNGENKYTFFMPILPQPGNKKLEFSFLYKFKLGDGDIKELFTTKKTPEEGLQAGKVYEIDFTKNFVSGEWPQINALTEFYESTNGAGWHYNDNWLSKEPLESWYGVNGGKRDQEYVYTLDLSDNNLTGTLPESFASLMDKAEKINLSRNNLSGQLPNAVKSHKNWNKLGWLIVPQETRKGGGFDLSNSNLTLPNFYTSSLFDGEKASIMNIINRNKLVQIICINTEGIESLMNGFAASRVNLHLDYHEKGVETLIFTGKDENKDNKQLIDDIQKKYGNLPGVHWFNYTPNFTIYYNMSYLFDTSGQLVHIAPYSTTDENESVHQALNEFLFANLGRAVKHDPFSFNFYTSSDYSKHGEVFKFQTATEGNGIDLVFIGEGFVDTDMADNGKYEMKMKEAADKLFELEPYKSLRNRFNLYGVKVVSPVAEFVEEAGKAINEDNDKAFELASLYNPNLPEDARMMVVVVYNTQSSVGRSYCVLHSTGDFVTYVKDGINNTLIHEVGGHGIAKLADEYVEGGYENIALPESEKSFLDNAMTWDWGWFANVDYNNTKSSVRWSRFLNDSRYAEDNLGIYEGAYTFGKGAYRSSDNSMMRYNISWFNAPSREAIYKAVMTLSEGDSWTYDYEEFVSFDSKNIGATQSRNAMMQQTDDEIRQIQENHRKPVFVRGSWRYGRQNAKNNNIIVPLR